MSTRLRRAAALAVVPVLALSLAACGSSDTAKGFDAVTIGGSFGQAPTITWKKQMEATDPVTKTLVKGTGTTLADGDNALVNIAVADGWTQETPVTTFGQKYGSLVVPLNSAAIQPHQIGDLFVTFLQNYVKPGVTVGTRIAVAVGATQAFPSYVTALPSAHLNIGNEDGLVIVADVVGVQTSADASEKAPTGTAPTPATWAPKLVSKDGAPSALDFKGTPAPSGKLQTTTLIQGSGPSIADGSTAVVKYLGQVYRGAKPFDEDFSKQSVLNVLIGKGVQVFQNDNPTNGLAVLTVLPGWQRALVDVKVGSRVLIQIPPKLGYGATAKPGIPANSTLYFVVDVLAAG
ncbi:MAG TPA: FKBP-type peptidyl-prolyl cis-trans isomerase [Nocardioides sp.]|nr:FKBP-type peptidyl-prolyl cis-trans isomerase [Nocardioides sp.]